MKPERWHEVDKILQSVLERDPAERGAYLDQVCAGDEQLRHAVLTVMASYKEDGTFMASPVLEVSGDDFADGAKLKPGDSIGPYRIRKPIGRGGMGEVYLAEHTTLSREVALKILPEHFLDDAQRVQRFRQEARAVLALNHPNVVTVYDIGEAEGVHFISTEFVEGQTLRERMAHARLTVSEAIEIAAQVAGAIAYAHEKGVIHRDIKPENIMLRPDGYVKVLDFGIAKLTERQTKTTADPNEAQTRMKVETSPGMVMGTAHYMSPEQARGKKVDERTDTWSLGAVLYEMLTGRPPFEGETPSDIIGLILQRDPAPLSALMPDAPPELERIVSKALDKSQDERYQTAKDLLADLRRFKRRYEHDADIERSMPPSDSKQVAAQVSTGGQRVNATGAGEPNTAMAVAGPTASSAEYIVSEFKRHRTGVLITLLALVVVIAGVGFELFKFRSRTTAGQTAPALKMTPLPMNGIVRFAVLSPDGKYIAYRLASSEQGSTQSLWVKHLPTDSELQILPPTKNGLALDTFTADSNYLYYAERNIETNVNSFNRVPVVGGVPKKLIDNINDLQSYAISPDGKQFAGIRINKGVNTLIVANEDGTGEKSLATRGGEHEWFDGSPAWSPDSHTIACFAGSNAVGESDTLIAVNVADGAQKQIGTMKWTTLYTNSIVWLPGGSGMIVSAGESFAAPIQLWYVSYPAGAPRRLINDLNSYYIGGVTADAKTLLAVQSKTSADVWVLPASGDASQPKQVTFTNADWLGSPAAWTPDGQIVLDSTAGGRRSLWVMGADGSNRRPLLRGTDEDYGPSVSPDGRYVAFTSMRNGGLPHLWRVDMDGRNLRQLTFGDSEDARSRWMPDGKWLIFQTWRSEGKSTVWKMPAEGGEAVQLSDKALDPFDLSPDGKLIACYGYGTSQPGRTKVFLLPIEGGEPAKVLELPPASGGMLSWTADSHAITYVSSPDGVTNIWALPIDGGPPKQLTNFTASSGARNFDFYAFSRDRKRLAVTRTNVTSSLVLITDFK